MFEEHKDIKAAENEFADVFQHQDKNKKQTLVRYFLDGFLKSYDEIKEVFDDSVSPDVDQILLQSYGLILQASSTDNEVHKALLLGHGLGIFLATIDFIIVRPGLNLRRTEAEILGITGDIVKKLKAMERNVNYKPIRQRIEKIIREHKNKLSSLQKRLLTAFAAQFSS